MIEVEREASVQLQVTAILDDAAALDVVRQVVANSRDELSIAAELSEGIALTQAEAPDVVFIDVGMSKGAALALVHHLRAVVPNAVVYAMAQHEALQLATQAIALGASGILMLPLSGDELLTALAEVRVRHAERRRRDAIEQWARRQQRSAELTTRVAELGEMPSRRDAAARLAGLIVEYADAESVVVYLPAAEGSRQLMQAAHAGPPTSAPPFCDDMELLAWAGANEYEVLRLARERETAGIVVLRCPLDPTRAMPSPVATRGSHRSRAAEPEGAEEHATEGSPPSDSRSEPFPLATLCAAQAATCFGLIAAREQSHRGAMKDPSSSAYTFAYFVDVAGREIDRSRRHGRRFALATIGVGTGPQANGGDRGIEVVERVLGTVRATDVLARIDDLEFYLLLPETGGIGAHVCRRRVLDQLRGRAEERIDVTVGAATYPHNGTDLSQLLRVAKHRADAAQSSIVRRLELDRLPLPEILDAVLWDQAASPRTSSYAEEPQTIELPAIDVMSLATCAVNEARRGGGARVMATLRPGVSVGAAIRAAIGRDASEDQVDLVDVTGSSGCEDLEALTVVAEHGFYVLLGRVERGHVRGIHCADPSLVDTVTRRLGEAARDRLVG